MKTVFDTRQVEALLTRLSDSLSSFLPETKQIGQEMSRRADMAFKNQGRGGKKWPPLKPQTVRARRERAKKTGRQPVAAFDTPLRFTDALRLDVIRSVEPAANEVVQFTTEPQARRLQEGDPMHNIPPREFLQILPEDSAAYQNLVGAGLKRRVVEASRAVASVAGHGDRHVQAIRRVR